MGAHNLRLKPVYVFFWILILSILTVGWSPSISGVSEMPLSIGAHRGNSAENMENTLAAIKSALTDTQYDFIEFDVRLTKDNQLVVFHDATLLRTHGKLQWVDALTYEELLAKSDYHIPLFEEVIALVGDQKQMLVDIKGSGNLEKDAFLIEQIIEQCQEKGLMSNIIIGSLSGEIISYISETYPEVKTGIMFWINGVTYFPSQTLVRLFYEHAGLVGADYVFFHGINIRNYSLLEQYLPADMKLGFWYFNDTLFVLE